MGAAMGTVRVPVALFGFPSVQSIVEGIVEFFFQDLARALVPDFLKKASVATIKWLVALPDPTGWPHVAQLEGDMAVLAGSLLAVSFTAAIVRYLTVGVTGSASPLAPLSSTVSSAAMIVGYRWAAHEAVAGVNAFTGSILGFSVVGDGLQRTVGLLFGGALLVGSGSLFFALLAIVAVVFAAVMFAIKVLLLIGVGLLYVTGLLAIALRPLGDAGGLARAWLSMAMTIALVPVGWTILFALAGALSLDATSLGAAGAGGLPGHVAAALAALLTFYLAVKLPLAALSHLRSSIVGMASSARAGGGSSSNGGSGSTGGGVGRVADAHARLRAGGLQAGRTIGSAAGALGAPAGGAVGLAGRAAAGLAGPVGFGIAAAGALASRVGGRGGSGNGTASAVGAGDGASPRSGRGGERDGAGGGGNGGGGSAGGGQEAGGLRGRVARAERVLGDGPGQVRDAMRAAGSTGTGRGRPAGGGSTGAAGSRSAGKAPRRPRPAEKSPARSTPTQRNGQARGEKAPTADRPSGRDARTRPGVRTNPPAPPPTRRADEAISGDARARRKGSRAPVRKPNVKPPAEGRVRRQPRERSGRREPRPRTGTQRRRWWRLGRAPRKGSG